MYNILICDDERDIVSAIKIYLSAEGYKTFSAYNGLEALEIIKNNNIHLVLLDIMMPKMDGILTISKIREENNNVPVIFLSAKSEDSDKIIGLNLGADDYITKPFNPVELIARVRSHLRRYMSLGSHCASQTGASSTSSMCVGGICLDDKAKEVYIDGEIVNLTPTEYDILKLFMVQKGEVLSIKDIYRKVWNDDPFGSENTVAVHIRHLREKIEINPADPRYLKVVWGKGYKLESGGK